MNEKKKNKYRQIHAHRYVHKKKKKCFRAEGR